MEGFDIGRARDPGAHDPGRAAREAADRIAEQVRDILQNAEQRANDIRSGAEADAEAIRKDAAESTARMLNRVDQLEQQLESYLTEFFQTIRGELSGLADRQDVEAAAASFRHAPADDTTEAFGPGPFEEPRFEPTPRPEGAQQQPEPPTVAEPEPAPEQEQEPQTMPPEGQNGEPRRRRGLLWGRRERGGEEPAPPIAGTEAEDAHVMALNMALNGTPREETEDYLRQRFAGVKDLDSILDDVYGRVKGR